MWRLRVGVQRFNSTWQVRREKRQLREWYHSHTWGGRWTSQTMTGQRSEGTLEKQDRYEED